MKFLLNPKTKFIFSMLVFGTLGLFVRIIPVSSGEIALYRAVLAVLLIFIGFLIGKKKISFLKIKKELIGSHVWFYVKMDMGSIPMF